MLLVQVPSRTVRTSWRATRWGREQAARYRQSGSSELEPHLVVFSALPGIGKAVPSICERRQMSADVLRCHESTLFSRWSYINQVAIDLANAPAARPLPRRRAALDPIPRANILASRLCRLPASPAAAVAGTWSPFAELEAGAPQPDRSQLLALLPRNLCRWHSAASRLAR